MFSSKKHSTERSQKIGILNLAGERTNQLVKEDALFLSRLFESIEIQDSATPSCDVLFVYADIALDGCIIGSAQGLREIISQSGARIVVVASENAPESYIKAGAPRPYGRANLVMTLNRRGKSFECFFTALFSKMKKGVMMPDAWVQLNPQIPDHSGGGNPETIFACEIGPLSFA